MFNQDQSRYIINVTPELRKMFRSKFTRAQWKQIKQMARKFEKLVWGDQK